MDKKIGLLCCPATTPKHILRWGNSFWARQNRSNRFHFGSHLTFSCASMFPWLQIWMDIFLELELQSPSFTRSMRVCKYTTTSTTGDFLFGVVTFHTPNPCPTLGVINMYGTRLGHSWRCSEYHSEKANQFPRNKFVNNFQPELTEPVVKNQNGTLNPFWFVNQKNPYQHQKHRLFGQACLRNYWTFFFPVIPCS